MTPARHAEIRAYINRLDLNQLPGWTIEQRIVADLWETLPQVWDEARALGIKCCGTIWLADDPPVDPLTITNPYRDGER